jgi:pectin methylesterase-like acyl-CoA thioesterase
MTGLFATFSVGSGTQIFRNTNFTTNFQAIGTLTNSSFGLPATAGEAYFGYVDSASGSTTVNLSFLLGPSAKTAATIVFYFNACVLCS